jgi:acyl-coenzyme A thioesterase PaaI-like protein
VTGDARAASRRRALDLVRALATGVARHADISDEQLDMIAGALPASGATGETLPPSTSAWRYENVAPFFPDMTFEVDGQGLPGTVRFDRVFEGAGGVVHGGFVAAVFDQALGAAALARTVSRTASITIDYRNPVPINRELAVAAVVDRVEGRKLWVSGHITGSEQRYAEAAGLWISVDSY